HLPKSRKPHRTTTRRQNRARKNNRRGEKTNRGRSRKRCFRRSRGGPTFGFLSGNRLGIRAKSKVENFGPRHHRREQVQTFRALGLDFEKSRGGNSRSDEDQTRFG